MPEGGVGALPAALARYLDVRLQTTVQRVEIGPDGRATALGYRHRPETRAYGIGVPNALGHPLAAIEWTHTKGSDRAPADRGLAVVMPTHAWSVASARQPDGAVASDLVAAVDSLYPGSAAAAHFYRVVRWEYAMPVTAPGWAGRLAAALAAGPAPGSPVFACGDYWAGPNTEWALTSGWRAAAELLRSLGRNIPPEYAV